MVATWVFIFPYLETNTSLFQEPYTPFKVNKPPEAKMINLDTGHESHRKPTKTHTGS